jgi:hypothetical protein
VPRSGGWGTGHRASRVGGRGTKVIGHGWLGRRGRQTSRSIGRGNGLSGRRKVGAGEEFSLGAEEQWLGHWVIGAGGGGMDGWHWGVGGDVCVQVVHATVFF